MPHLPWLNFSGSMNFSQENKNKTNMLHFALHSSFITRFYLSLSCCMKPLTARFLAVSGFHLDRMMHLKFKKETKKGEKRSGYQGASRQCDCADTRHHDTCASSHCGSAFQHFFSSCLLVSEHLPEVCQLGSSGGK